MRVHVPESRHQEFPCTVYDLSSCRSVAHPIGSGFEDAIACDHNGCFGPRNATIHVDDRCAREYKRTLRGCLHACELQARQQD
jgi:hypothetical protein